MAKFSDTMISVKNKTLLTDFYKRFAGLKSEQNEYGCELLKDPATGQVLALAEGVGIKHPALSIEVDDIAKAATDLKSLGGSVITTWEYAGMNGINGADPEGNELVIFQFQR